MYVTSSAAVLTFIWERIYCDMTKNIATIKLKYIVIARTSC